MNMILFICLVILLAGFIQGLTGFGSALVAVPLLSIALRIDTVVPLILLNGLILNFFMAYQLRGSFSLRKIIPLVLGVIPGSLIGFMFHKSVDQEILKGVIGFIVFGYGLYTLLPDRRLMKIKDFWGIPVGLFSGLLGTALSIGGPPVIIYSTMKNWSIDQIKSTISGFFCVSTVIAVSIHATGGTMTKDVLLKFAFSTPFIVLGAVMGLFLGAKLNRQTYITIVNLLLIVIGLKLLLGYFL